jgi:hypothetical protein
MGIPACSHRPFTAHHSVNLPAVLLSRSVPFPIQEHVIRRYGAFPCHSPYLACTFGAEVRQSGFIKRGTDTPSALAPFYAKAGRSGDHHRTANSLGPSSCRLRLTACNSRHFDEVPSRTGGAP